MKLDLMNADSVSRYKWLIGLGNHLKIYIFSVTFILKNNLLIHDRGHRSETTYFLINAC